jgi:hypothetical protein
MQPVRHDNNYMYQFALPENNILSAKGKGKAIPLQAWTGSEGSRRLMLPDFKTIGT